MNSVLITGSSGFIGGHLVQRLSAMGVRTKCLVRSTSSRTRLESCDAELIAGDVTDPESLRTAVEGADAVFHLAGLTCALRRSDFFRVNGEGPGNLAAACASLANPPVLVLVSSIAAAGPPTSAAAIRVESDQPRPVSQYGHSKLAGEQAARRFADRVPTTVVRPGVVFGEHDPGMAVLTKSIRQTGIHLNAGFRSPRLSIIYARDLVEILIAAAEKGERLLAGDRHTDPGHGIYFAVGPEYPTYSELGRIIAPEVMKNGSGLWNIYVPGPVAFLLGAINEGICLVRGKPDIFSRDKVREGLVASWACSCEKVKQHFSWQPSGPLVEQLRATARWYIEQGWT